MKSFAAIACVVIAAVINPATVETASALERRGMSSDAYIKQHTNNNFYLAVY
jgi:hypothetical protein